MGHQNSLGGDRTVQESVVRVFTIIQHKIGAHI